MGDHGEPNVARMATQAWAMPHAAMASLRDFGMSEGERNGGQRYPTGNAQRRSDAAWR